MQLSKKIALSVLALVSFSTTLWGLSFTNSVIFDEFHFGKFINAYCCTHARFFDIHPPHAKLFIAGTSYLLGYRGDLAYEGIGHSFGDSSPFPVRFLPALAGALLPLVLYGILRATNVSVPFSFMGGLLVALDNATTLQSRIVGLDSILLLTTFTAIWLFVLWLKSPPKSPKNIWLLLGSGTCAGLAAGSKFTGLAVLGVIGIIVGVLLIRELWESGFHAREKLFRYVGSGLAVLGAAIVIYLVGWIIHVNVLSEPGAGDAWGERTGNVIVDIVQEHKAMLNANYNLKATHAYSSMWWSWPAMARPVFYWADGGTWIYFIGNPVVWWGATIMFVVAVIHYLLESRIRNQQPLVGILLLGFVAAYLPFVRIPRALFLYHYLTPLIFSLLFSVWWIDVVLPKKYRNRVVLAVAALAVVGFVAFSPLTYGFNAWQQHLIWFPGWR